MLTVEIPGTRRLELEHVVFDLNGTLTDRGELITGVSERLTRLRRGLEIWILSADTFGALERIAGELGVRARVVSLAEDKERHLLDLGANRCAAVGNGANDRRMLAAAALGIAVLGPEGTAGATLAAADVVCRSIVEALDLLLDARALAATLRR